MNEFEKQMSELRLAHKNTNRQICAERDSRVRLVTDQIKLLRRQGAGAVAIMLMSELRDKIITDAHRMLSKEGRVYHHTLDRINEEMRAHYAGMRPALNGFRRHFF